MAAPVEPEWELGGDGLPVWFPADDDVPDEDLPDDARGLRLSDAGCADLIREDLALDAFLDRAADPAADPGSAEPDGAGWAVPGLDPTDPATDPGGLSAASTAVLAETADSVRALRLAHARVYRALGDLQASDAVDESGYRCLSRLLEDHVRLDQQETRRLAAHAAALTPPPAFGGDPTPAELPATAALVDDGAIGPGHVQIIRTTMRRLAAVVPALDPEVLATTETQLAELATTHAPAALASAARTILALLDPDGTAPDDSPPPDNELHYLRRRNGTLVGKFTYRDPAAAEHLHTALTLATPPPDASALADPDGRGPAGDHGRRGETPAAHALRTLPERRAHALLDLAAEALTRGLNTTDPEPGTPTGTGSDVEETTSWGLFTPEDEDSAADQGETTDDEDIAGPHEDPAEPPPPEPEASSPEASSSPPWQRAAYEGGERITLTLTVDYETLARRLDDTPERRRQLALLGENTWIRPETARRLACDADLIPALMSTAGLPLDLGRKHRTAPAHLRHALYLRDRHCAHPGCRRRARKTHAHHVLHWIDGGLTEPDNCVLLCSYHHTLIHHSGWSIEMIDGLPWFRPPLWLDPTQTLRHNRPWQAA